MRYYSDKTRDLYNSVEELTAAEEKCEQERIKSEKAKEVKMARAKEIEDAYKEIEAATHKYNELVNKFVKDYGTYHTSISRQVISPKSLIDFLIGW